MGDFSYRYPGILDFPKLGRAPPDGELVVGITKNWWTIDLRENKLSALPLRVQHVLRDRLPKVARCASCETPTSRALRRCRCGITKIKLAPQDLCRIDRSIRRHSHHMRNWREALLPGYHTDGDLAEILKIQNGRCYFCNWKLIWRDGRKFPRCDHLIPITDRRASAWPSNIVLVCPHCNNSKWNLSANDFWLRLEKQRGVNFIQVQKARARLYDQKRRKLDKPRKDAVMAACAKLEKDLATTMKAQKRGGVVSKVSYKRKGATIHVGLVEVRLPGVFHARLVKWSTLRRRDFCDQLHAISDIAGGRIIQPY